MLFNLSDDMEEQHGLTIKTLSDVLPELSGAPPS